MADLLRGIGPLSAAEVAERCQDPAAAAGWLAGLAGQRRVLQIRVAGEARWAAIEDAGRLRDALGVPLPPGVPAAFTEPVADPLGDLTARYARGTARSARPTWPPGTGSAWPWSPGRCAGWPRTAGSPRVNSCPGGAARSGATPACCACCAAAAWPSCAGKRTGPASALARFLPAWQNAGHPLAGPDPAASSGPARGGGGPDQVYEAIDQLAGAGAAAPRWRR